LEFYNGQELMDSLDLTVSEDREKLDDIEASPVQPKVETQNQVEMGIPLPYNLCTIHTL